MVIASLDIGSNTVLLLIAEVKPEELKITPIRDEQRIPRISEDLTRRGIISDESVGRLLNALREYRELIKAYNCEKIIISGTSAFRKAGNSTALKSLIENEFDSEMNILSGDEEAQFAFLGTMGYGSTDEHRLVIDIGGGSTEIIYGTDKIISFSKSFDIGVVSLSEKYLKKNEPAESKLNVLDVNIKNALRMLPELHNAPVKSIALAGTPVALACIYKGIQEYDESTVEGVVLSKQIIEELLIFISKHKPEELLAKFPMIVKGREDLILSGTSILLNICKLLKLSEIIVSTKGIRYGAIIKLLMKDS